MMQRLILCLGVLWGWSAAPFGLRDDVILLRDIQGMDFPVCLPETDNMLVPGARVGRMGER